ncbi:MAG: hypothetical protein WBL50_21550 [Candidatus Acidiferrum sp.]
MLSRNGTLIVFCLLAVIAAAAVLLSADMLFRGRLYHRLKPKSRPRRWVLISLLILFAVFIAWFPPWIMWPHALISRLLTGLFAITFGIVGLTLRLFSPLVDRYFTRKGWPLR